MTILACPLCRVVKKDISLLSDYHKIITYRGLKIVICPSVKEENYPIFFLLSNSLNPAMMELVDINANNRN